MSDGGEKRPQTKMFSRTHASVNTCKALFKVVKMCSHTPGRSLNDRRTHFPIWVMKLILGENISAENQSVRFILASVYKSITQLLTHTISAE